MLYNKKKKNVIIIIKTDQPNNNKRFNVILKYLFAIFMNEFFNFNKNHKILCCFVIKYCS